MICMRLEMRKLREIVGELCKVHGCTYAILFGSQACGVAKPYSDIDIAVKFRGNVDYLKGAFEMASDLEERLGIHVDVVAVNVADTILKYEVFSSGMLLYCENYDEYMDDFINSIDEWLDFQYHFNKFYNRVIKEMRDAISRSES